MLTKFSNNGVSGGFSSGGYDEYAPLPTNLCWTRQAKFLIPRQPIISRKIFIDNSSIDSSSFCIDRNKNVLLTINDTSILTPEWGKIISIDTSGNANEVFHSEKRLYHLTLTNDGNILCVLHQSSEAKILCLSAEGIVLWEYAFESEQPTIRPILDQNSNIYFFAFFNRTGILYCISKSGNLLWKKAFPSMCWTEPAISQNGTIYIGLNKNRTLYALDSNGEILWSKEVGLINQNIQINQDGSLYLVLFESPSSQTNSLVALSSSGEYIWKYQVNEVTSISSGIALDNFKNLYFNTSQFEIISVDSNGNLRWKNDISQFSSCPPIIGSNKVLFQQSWVHTSNSHKSFLQAYQSETGEKLWTQSFNGFILSAALAADNEIYLLSSIERRTKQGWLERKKIHAEFYVICDPSIGT